MNVPVHFTPRDYQLETLENIRDKWLVVLEWARRAGKGLFCWIYAILRMVEEPIGVIIIYPTAEQGYNAFWTNIENDGFKTIEHIPKSLILRQTNSKDDMFIELKNGSTITLIGANANPEKLRGNNTKIYILSEFVDINSSVLGIITPIIIANGGQLILESTPKQDGVSGATFIKMRKAAEKDPKQYASKIPATRYMTAEQLEMAEKACITQYGNNFMYRQEYLLDEGVALATSYYGNILSAMEDDGRVGKHGYDKDYPVYTAWDLGMADSTAVWFWQYYDNELHIIDYYETHDIGDAPIVQLVLSKGYNCAWHFFPHDGSKRDSDAIPRIQKIRDLGLPNSSLILRSSKEDGIKKTVEMLNKSTTTFHQPTTYMAIDKLKKYKRTFNAFTGDYEGPEHKSESHAADSLRYVVEAIDQSFSKTNGTFLYGESESDTYESEDVVNGLYKEQLYNVNVYVII